MNAAQYQRKSRRFHWRMHVAVGLGILVGTAILTGALIVGDSMRAGLKNLALSQLGPVTDAMIAPTFFSEGLYDRLNVGLADELPADDCHLGDEDLAPLLLINAGATHAESHRRASNVTVFGVDDRFWKLAGQVNPASDQPLDNKHPAPRSVSLNQELANRLDAAPGDDILLRVGKPNPISIDTLFGRRDDTTTTLRLTVDHILTEHSLQNFNPSPSQHPAANAFVDINTLQQLLNLQNQINTIVYAPRPPDSEAAETIDWHRLLTDAIRLEDIGLEITTNDALFYTKLNSKRFLLDQSIESAAHQAGRDLGLKNVPVLTYLANDIAKVATHNDPSQRSVPYSTISAIPDDIFKSGNWSAVAGPPVTDIKPGHIIINEWTADQLNAQPGDRIDVTYYQSGDFGQLETQNKMFTLQTVVKLGGPAADPEFTPQYEGITEAATMADWDPPFPIDYTRVNDDDDQYWEQHKTTPKAFIRLEEGQKLWTKANSHLGKVTSILFVPNDESAPSISGVKNQREQQDRDPNRSVTTPSDTTTTPVTPDQRIPAAYSAAEIEVAILTHVDPNDHGLIFETVRKRALNAGKGTTDFGVLFLSFSFFLIASAVMLISLLERLGIERRAKELGLLQALGFQSIRIRNIIVRESITPAVVAVLIGSAASIGYAALLILGLKTKWADAVNNPHLELSLTATSLAIGAISGLLIALITIALSVRTIVKLPAAQLLAGRTQSPITPRRSPKRTFPLSHSPVPPFSHFLIFPFVILSLLTAIALPILSVTTTSIPQPVAFFLSGTLTLIALTITIAHRLKSSNRIIDNQEVGTTSPGTAQATTHAWHAVRPGRRAMITLGLRNIARAHNRSITTVALVATASFLLIAMHAFRISVDPNDNHPKGPSGGYSLYAEAAVPLPFDLNTTTGKEALNCDNAQLAQIRVSSFRLRKGDETSCLNLYAKADPRILGAPEQFVTMNRFAFSAVMDQAHDQPENPWSLLNSAIPNDVIPVIGDEAAVKWQLHSGLGKSITISDEAGRQVDLQFVALLKGSALQSELIISEANFRKLFPSIEGHSFFLIESQSIDDKEITTGLEDCLSPFSFDAEPVAGRLSAYVSVQNTYLSTFQMLGGFGLLLGTLGITVVMLRNIWERRGELALMEALGFRRNMLWWLMMAENVWLVLLGIGSGALSAAVPVVPLLIGQREEIDLASILGLICMVIGIGVVSGWATLSPTLRKLSIRDLRQE